jgi:hypothetical protein
MRGHMAISLFALVFGALETGGAVQELVYRGILNSETNPMMVGALGTLTGAMLLWTGVALLIRSRLVSVLVPATVFLHLRDLQLSLVPSPSLLRMADHAGGYHLPADHAALVQNGRQAGSDNPTRLDVPYSACETRIRSDHGGHSRLPIPAAEEATPQEGAIPADSFSGPKGTLEQHANL